jgi:hypothetical protein
MKTFLHFKKRIKSDKNWYGYLKMSQTGLERYYVKVKNLPKKFPIKNIYMFAETKFRMKNLNPHFFLQASPKFKICV